MELIDRIRFYFQMHASAKFIAIALLITAVPLTVFVAQKRQEVRQHAAAPNSFASVGVVRAGNQWFLKSSNSSGNADVSFTYGTADSTQNTLSGDWTGKGFKTPGIFKDGQWYLRNSNATGNADTTFTFGVAGDIPIVGDWDGNGTDTVGVFRPSEGNFYLKNSNSSGNADIVFTFGISGDIPVSGRWSAGATYDSVGVFRNGQWFIKNDLSSGQADSSFTFGNPSDTPITGDWNATGTTKVGVFRNGTFFLRNSLTSGQADTTFTLGVAGDKPITGYWGSSSPTAVPTTALGPQCTTLKSNFLAASGSQRGGTNYKPYLDFNNDGVIDGVDLTIFSQHSSDEGWCQSANSVANLSAGCQSLYTLMISAWNKRTGESGFDAHADLNKDNVINSQDFLIFLQHATDNAWCSAQLTPNPTPTVPAGTPPASTAPTLTQAQASCGNNPGASTQTPWVTLSWTPVAGAQGYNIYRNHAPVSASSDHHDSGNEAVYIATVPPSNGTIDQGGWNGATLSNNVTYTYEVQADGGVHSNQKTVTTLQSCTSATPTTPISPTSCPIGSIDCAQPPPNCHYEGGNSCSCGQLVCTSPNPTLTTGGCKTDKDCQNTQACFIQDACNSNSCSGSCVTASGGTKLALKIKLDGIGGDDGGNTSPLHPTRPLLVELFDTNNLMKTFSGQITFNQSEKNFFSGTVSIADDVVSGKYYAKVKTPGFLKKKTSGLFDIVTGQTTPITSVSPLTLISGDINDSGNDNYNKLNIADYNVLRDCGYAAIKPLPISDPNSLYNSPACVSHSTRDQADLDDNGIIDAFDFGIFIRELGTQSGD